MDPQAHIIISGQSRLVLFPVRCEVPAHPSHMRAGGSSHSLHSPHRTPLQRPLHTLIGWIYLSMSEGGVSDQARHPYEDLLYAEGRGGAAEQERRDSAR